MLDRLPQNFLDHIELWLSGAALILIFGIPELLGPSGPEFWRITAIIAVVVGSLHGVLFWGVRRRQRQVRREAIQNIQAMLADVIKNRLTAIDMYLPQDDDPELLRREVEGIRTSIREISDEVDTLSEESLEAWEERYEEALQGTPAPEGNQ